MDDSMIKEGLVLVHGKGTDNKPLFYNHSQVFNRDLSLIVLKSFIIQEKRKTGWLSVDYKFVESNPKLGKFVGVNILETLAATGIRGIRYLKELGDLVNLVTFNDLDRNSAEMIVKNASLNEVKRSKFRVTCCDANLLSSIFTPPPDVAKYFQMAGNIFRIPAGTLNVFTDVLKEFNKTVDAFLKIVSVTDVELRGGNNVAEVRMVNGEEVTPESYRNIVDVIDLDPYSSATGFIDSAVRSVKSGGILLITSTDMPTLCGNNPLVSFYKYGGTSFKSPFCHELSLRTLLYSVMLTASRYKRTMKPLISCSVDFYVRVVVQVKYFPEECKRVASNAGLVLMCVQCHSYRIVNLCEDFNGDESEKNKAHNQRKRKHKRPMTTSNFAKVCEECGGRMKVGGPIYIGPLHDKQFVENCIKLNGKIFKTNDKRRRSPGCKKEEAGESEEVNDENAVKEESTTNVENSINRNVVNDKGINEEGVGEVEERDNPHLTGVTMAKRIRGLLLSIKEELDVPMFYSVSDLCQIWNLSTISPIVFRKVLENMGYKASNFHRDPNSIKTDAPNHVVMDIIRTHAKNSQKVPKHEFFNREIDTLGIDLDLKINRVKKVPRWIPNPTSHWGPKKKHRTCSSSIKS
ncbi:N2,N2-dimethylguanosine tRNA methyltransferase [Theileria orientalis strain Shintoku]|uniref:tRNA (guanine(26)-N(2))-dimethyltransferase n=1 Tax=Theileria orientalis strain Shintoku TaxID=869250 RepID=J4CCZ5_THEOR|nr:N2,N2-dimethylguanosine tRNA methyltransferase [Theileria orientalis strain Shintoku]BAM40252.1 N2,N2-dimethylguanosine tRNA methyltransferase [Theileria orientalis strain Shintoku]|eukprot:XP_009690553.1 N2,N2-dimethylguanosine tRNA methyltransferase [Theileria orientalis strain Shintoku]